MQKKSLVAALAVLLLAMAAWLLIRQLRSPSAESPVHNAVGVALANHVSALLGGAGQIVLLTPNGRAEDTPESSAFAEAVGKNGRGLQLAGCEPWTTQWSALEGGGFLSAGTLQAVAAKYPQAGVIVSVEGVPDPREIGRWPTLSAKLVVISVRQPRDVVLAAKPVTALALVARPIADAVPDRRATPEQTLAKAFETL